MNIRIIDASLKIGVDFIYRNIFLRRATKSASPQICFCPDGVVFYVVI